MPLDETPSVADAGGVGQTVEYLGKTYHLAPPDHQDVLARYSRHLRERSLAEVDQVFRLLGPAAGAEAMRAHVENGTAGAFDLGSALWGKSLEGRDNQVALTWFELLVHQPKLTRLTAQAVYDHLYGRGAADKALAGDAEPRDPEVPTTAPA